MWCRSLALINNLGDLGSRRAGIGAMAVDLSTPRDQVDERINVVGVDDPVAVGVGE